MRTTSHPNILLGILLLSLGALSTACDHFRSASGSNSEEASDTIITTPEEKVAGCTFFRMALEESTLANVPLDDYERAAFQHITGIDTTHYPPAECAKKIMQRSLRNGYKLAAYHISFGSEGTQVEQYLAVYNPDNRLSDAMMLGYWCDFRDVLKMPNDSANIQQRFPDDLYCTITEGDSIIVDRSIWYSLDDDTDQFGGKISHTYTINDDGQFVLVASKQEGIPKLNAIAVDIMQLRQSPLSTPDLAQKWEQLETPAMSVTPTAADYRLWFGRYRMKTKQ